MTMELDPPSIAVRSSQPLVGLFVEDDSNVVRYFAGDVPATEEDAAVIADALALAGAWSDLDWRVMADELDRIRHAGPPAPPIEL